MNKQQRTHLCTAWMPCKAAKFASWYISSKLFWMIASLLNMESDKTTAVAPLEIYSPIESVSG